MDEIAYVKQYWQNIMLTWQIDKQEVSVYKFG